MGIAAPAWGCVDGTVRQAAATLPMKDTLVTLDRPDLEVYADHLLGRVFENLIDNALKYGGEKITGIGISAQETGEGLTLIFEDNSRGITGKDKRHLFERGFWKNTGLDLFLSREILAITGIALL